MGLRAMGARNTDNGRLCGDFMTYRAIRYPKFGSKGPNSPLRAANSRAKYEHRGPPEEEPPSPSVMRSTSRSESSDTSDLLDTVRKSPLPPDSRASGFSGITKRDIFGVLLLFDVVHQAWGIRSRFHGEAGAVFYLYMRVFCGKRSFDAPSTAWGASHALALRTVRL